MSVNIALSGIAAAQKDLNTTANNVANVNTVGFKESRAEFENLYSNSIFANKEIAVGGGVTTSKVAQQFHQGSFKFTSNALDMAINGSGFFVTSPSSTTQDYSFTRAGSFKIDANSYLVNHSGEFLMTFPVDGEGATTASDLVSTTPIQIPNTSGATAPTTEIEMGMNLSAQEEKKVIADFDPSDSETYNNSTSCTFYDSLGEAHVLTTYFVRPEKAAHSGGSSWVAFYAVDGAQLDVGLAATYEIDTTNDNIPNSFASASNADGWKGAVVKFSATGSYISTNPASVETETLGKSGANVLQSGANSTQTLTINFKNPTQFAADFDVLSLTQNGSVLGTLNSVDIAANGLITATYSNGANIPQARVALAQFANEQGLAPVGNSWKASYRSGSALVGEPKDNGYGSISSSTLELSNVDLTAELVDLISAQRNFQANSRVFEVNNTLQQSILQIR